jgi:hypothetical protein
MANKEHIFLLCLFQNVINDSWEVLDSTLVPTIVPKIRARAASVQSCVVSGVSVPSGICHPDIIAFHAKENMHIRPNLSLLLLLLYDPK